MHILLKLLVVISLLFQLPLDSHARTPKRAQVLLPAPAMRGMSIPIFLYYSLPVYVRGKLRPVVPAIFHQSRNGCWGALALLFCVLYWRDRHKSLHARSRGVIRQESMARWLPVEGGLAEADAGGFDACILKHQARMLFLHIHTVCHRADMGGVRNMLTREMQLALRRQWPGQSRAGASLTRPKIELLQVCQAGQALSAHVHIEAQWQADGAGVARQVSEIWMFEQAAQANLRWKLAGIIQIT